MKTALKNAAKIIAFLLIFLFILRSVSYVLRTNGDSKDRFMGFYAEEKNTIDVLMMGSSTTGTSFIPAYMWDRYGFTSYPLSSNSQRPKAIKYLIEEGLKYQSPDLVLIEMRTFIAEDEELATDEGHIRETVDNMKYSLHRIKTINALTDKLDDKYTFYLDIIKYHSNWGQLLMPSEWRSFDYSSKSKLKGFQMNNHTEPYRKQTPDPYTEDRIAIPAEQEAVLRDLLGYLKENNITALFVVSPRDELEEYEEKMNYCSDIVTAEGFDFLNLNYRYKEMNFDYKYDIDDGAHTNAWGAVKCSEVLGKYIKENYNVGHEYSSKTIENWNEAYAYFAEEYEKLEPIEK